MDYRIDKQSLLDRIGAWDGFLRKKIHLIACGGTALTLLNIKASTFKETASFDVSQANVLKNFEHFVRIIKKEGILDEKQ